jgi:hypothetical protein
MISKENKELLYAGITKLDFFRILTENFLVAKVGPQCKFIGRKTLWKTGKHPSLIQACPKIASYIDGKPEFLVK